MCIMPKQKNNPLHLYAVSTVLCWVTSKQMSTARYIHTWTFSQWEGLLNIHLFKIGSVLICQKKNHNSSSYLVELLWLIGSRNNTLLLPWRHLLPCDSTLVAEHQHGAICISLNKTMSFYDLLDPDSWVRGGAWEFETILLCSFT